MKEPGIARLYTFPPAPNPRRLHTFLGGKRLRLPTRLVGLTRGEAAVAGDAGAESALRGSSSSSTTPRC